MRQITELVEKWGREKGIIGGSTPLKQFKKTMEEVIELHEALVLKDKLSIIDAIGDIQVTLILLSDMLGLDYDECLHIAYNEIKDRKGKMVDGLFVKDSI